MQPLATPPSPKKLPVLPSAPSASLKTALLALGADDVGFVPLSNPALDTDRADILRALPGAKSLISFVIRMNPDAIREPGRSVANLEFHHTMHGTDEVARDMVEHLRGLGHRAINPSAGFPMEMDKFPGKLWIVSHKKVAEAAGLGKMGIHRNVIHPKFGSFIFLGSVITDMAVPEEPNPLDFNPCFECRLCVAACPTGALSKDGELNFSACYTHNYREFMGGFNDFVETVVESKNRLDFRKRSSDAETASWWQSLSYGANYKAAYCMAVCPAGEDVIGAYREDRKEFTQRIVRPLQKKEEVIYVTENSDAEDVVNKRFKNKTTKYVTGTLRPQNIDGLIEGLPLVFQPGKSKGLSARYHFKFKRKKEHTRDITVVIDGQKLSITSGLEGRADTTVIAQEDAWLGFVRKEKSLLWQLLTFRIRVKGSVPLLSKFGECFSG